MTGQQRECSYCHGIETESPLGGWTCDTHCNGCGMDWASCSCEQDEATDIRFDGPEVDPDEE